MSIIVLNTDNKNLHFNKSGVWGVKPMKDLIITYSITTDYFLQLNFYLNNNFTNCHNEEVKYSSFEKFIKINHSNFFNISIYPALSLYHPYYFLSI